MKKNIIIYDFDGTLTPHPIPKFEILEKAGMKDGAHNPLFLELVIQKSKEKNINIYQALYETYFQIITEAKLKLNSENIICGYENINYNNGVLGFLAMLKKNNINNYLLSSGIKEFLNKITIKPYFKEIYATTFNYNNTGEITGIDYLMTDKNKVAAIKQILIKNNIQKDNCSNVIYIGDGLTDAHAFEYIKNHGGVSIFVYTKPNNDNIQTLKEKNIVNYYLPADFSNNSPLETIIKKLCNIN